MQFQCFYYKRLWGFIRVDSKKGFHIMGQIDSTNMVKLKMSESFC